MTDVKAMRQKLHGLVEDGDILGAIKVVGRYYGFTEFPIVSEVGGDWTYPILLPSKYGATRKA